MPISQITVLALYGELSNLVQHIDALEEHTRPMDGEQFPLDLIPVLREEIALAHHAAQRAQQAAIEVLLRDCPTIQINPLTGEAC